MKRSGSSRGGSRGLDKKKLAKGGVALLVAAVGAFFVTASFAQVMAKVDPARAATLAPRNGSVLSRFADQEFATEPSMDSTSQPAILARRALLADPTSAKALTVLAFQAQLRGETAKADRIFAYSMRLTRRELRPHIWAIENAVSQGDIAGALESYDLALRTSKDARPVLFPSLAASLSEPRIRAELLRIVATKPDWLESLLIFQTDSGIEPLGWADFLSEGRRVGLQATEAQYASLATRLLAIGERDRAWALYKSFRKGALRSQSRDPDFMLQGDARAPFDWRAGEDGALSVSILQRGKNGVVDFAVPPTVSGELVRQVQLLPAGRYRLSGFSTNIDQPASSRPYWLFACEDGRELGRVSLGNSREKPAPFMGEFEVPSGCPVQILSLNARSTDDINGVSGQIESASLVPASGSRKEN